MTGYPVIMIRRGPMKYIHCDSDPPQLYDLSADPMETKNLASDPSYSDAKTRFAAEVVERWDGSALRKKIIATQKSRRALHAAMEAGASEPWDYNPPSDASQQYVRNNMDWTVAARRYRYPPLKD
jgi:choline-sulfatase